MTVRKLDDTCARCEHEWIDHLRKKGAPVQYRTNPDTLLPSATYCTGYDQVSVQVISGKPRPLIQTTNSITKYSFCPEFVDKAPEPQAVTHAE